MKAHILIVEDEAILYEGMRRALIKERFTVAPYTPSVPIALKRIEEKKPDIVLSDIDLKGKLTGIDLGKRLKEEFKIPFIYITKFDDHQTFYKGLQTEHEQFIVKAKPTFNTQEMVRAIETVLHRIKKQTENIKIEEPTPNTASLSHKGIMGLTNYLDVLKEGGLTDISRVPVPYNDIAYFTVKPLKKSSGITEDIRTNYLWFQTLSDNQFYLKTSLRQLQQQLPFQFARINESYIVNLDSHILKGRINGSKLSIAGEILTVKDTYKEAVKKKIDTLYL